MFLFVLSWVAFLAALLVQVFLCFLAKKRLWRRLPLIVCGVWEVISWMALMVLRDLSINIAAVLILAEMLGFYLLVGVALGWLVYAVICGVKKLFHRR